MLMMEDPHCAAIATGCGRALWQSATNPFASQGSCLANSLIYCAIIFGALVRILASALLSIQLDT